MNAAGLRLSLAGLFMCLRRWQTRRIFPGAATQGRPEAAIPPGFDCEILWLQAADGIPISAVFAGALGPDGAPLPASAGRLTVLFFHGNASCIAQNLFELDRFRRLGIAVMMADYEGYGMSGGKPGEEGCYAAADAAYAHLAGRGDVDPRRIVAAGRSLGSAVAIDLASRRALAGLIAISPFTTLHDMARLVTPWIPPWLLRGPRFDSLSKMPRVSCPILILHGTRDDYVPPGMAETLSAAARTRVEHQAIEGGDHNNLVQAGGDRIWESIGGFLRDL